MNLKKNQLIITIFLIFLHSFFSLNAREAVYKGDDYTLHLTYSDNVSPGDALLLQLTYEPTFSLSSVFSTKTSQIISADAKLMISSSHKALREADMFSIDKTNQTLIAFIPLSTWYKPGKFSIKITYQVFKTNKKEIAPITEKMEFEVPIIMNDKEFLAETITLTPTNTAIKTDTSIRRKQEINTLHDIINTINRDAIHHLEPFICPVKATRRTSTFGDQRTYAHSNGTSSTSIHYGIDFGVPIGTAVHACGAGKVVLTENRVSSGLSIVIEHLPGLYSLYYHLDEFLVKEGDVITQGQEIAKSGNTGLSTGPHLHWEMRMLGHAVNPDWFVEKFTIMMQN